MKKGTCMIALSVAASTVMGCGASKAADDYNGFVQVSDDYVRQMPNEAMTAVLSRNDNRVTIEVNGPAACLRLTKEMPKADFAAGLPNSDKTANCVSRDGSVRVAIKAGVPFVPGKISTP